MEPVIKAIAIALLVPILASCEAVRLSQLSGEFQSTYDDKLRSQKLDSVPFPPSESVQGRFTQISEAATKAADELSLQEKPRLRIGYRRLAVMSAWQAADEQSASVLALQRKGQNDCRANKNYARSPRDCLMIELAGYLAAQDATWRRMERTSSAPAPADKRFASGSATEFKSAFDAFERYFKSMDTIVRNNKGTLAVPDELWKAVAEQMQRVYCNGQMAALRFSFAVSDAPAEWTETSITGTSLAKQLKALANKSAVQDAQNRFTALECQTLGRRTSAQPP